MGVYEARGQLGKSMKELMLRWGEAKIGWDDAVSSSIEKDFVIPLEADLRSALGALDHSGAVISQAKRDCADH